MESKVRAISITQPIANNLTMPEDIIVHNARVSNPKNQDNMKTADKLLKYCFDQGHISVFEMADLTVEITTSRAMGREILRHKSFCFQEFSQRYAAVDQFAFEIFEARRQDTKNRQNSIDDLPHEVKEWWRRTQGMVANLCHSMYQMALHQGIAKECARAVLPESATTKIYMKGNVRSWITYLWARLDESTQLEHREIAEQIKVIFCEHFPTIGKLLDDSQS
jgi:thymidylate synthase (FAD)